MAKTFFSASEQEQIIEAIRKAELNTSGEIRVHIEALCEGDPVARAKTLFEQLGMDATALKNGVLLYLAYESKKFALIGDSGIHEKVSQAYWEREIGLMTARFKEGKNCEALCLAIEDTGNQLKQYFPYQHDDADELSNDISFGHGGKDE